MKDNWWFARKLKSAVYGKKDKQETAKYASTHEIVAAFKKFKPKFPNLNETLAQKVKEKFKRKDKTNTE